MVLMAVSEDTHVAPHCTVEETDEKNEDRQVKTGVKLLMLLVHEALMGHFQAPCAAGYSFCAAGYSF